MASSHIRRSDGLADGKWALWAVALFFIGLLSLRLADVFAGNIPDADDHMRLQQIRDLMFELAESDCDAIAQVGTALPVVGLIDELERKTGKTIIACNAAVYWQTLRAAGIHDPVPGYGYLLREV